MKLINPNKLYSRYANGILELARKVAAEEISIGTYKAGANGQEMIFSHVSNTHNGLILFKFVGNYCAVEIVAILDSNDVIFNIKSNSIITFESYQALNLILNMMLDDLGIDYKPATEGSVAKLLRSTYDQFTVIKSEKRFSGDLLYKRLKAIGKYLKANGDPKAISTDNAWVDTNETVIKINAKYSTYITYDMLKNIIVVNSAYSLSNTVAISDEFDLIGIVKKIPKESN